MAGFGATVSSAVAGSGSAMSRAGAAAGILIAAPIVAAVGVGISQAVSFESALAGAAKTIGASEPVMEKIGQDIRDMAKELPFSREELLGMAEAVGRFGVEAKDIPEVTEMFAKLGTAIPDMDPTMAAEQMVRFFNVMKTPMPEWEQNLSSVVALGNDMATSEQQIISFASRLAQIGAFSTASEADILGLSSAFSAMNIRADAGASSLSRVFLEMDDAVKGDTKNMEIFTGLLGTTQEQFTQLYKTNPAQAFVDFSKGLKKVSDEGGSVTAVLDGLGINDIRVRRTLLAAMGNVELVEKGLSLANEAAGNNTALQEEFALRAETTASKWEMLKNRASDVALELGQALLPILLDVMEALEPFIDLLGLAARAFSSLPEGARQFISVFALILAILGPTVFLISRLIPMVGALRGALALLAASPVVLILMAIALAALLIILHWETLKGWFLDFFAWMDEKWELFKLGLEFYWDELKRKWTETWEEIANFFYGKWMTIKGWWDEFIGKIMEVIGWFINLRDNFGKAWDWIVQKAGQAKDSLIRILGEIGAAADRALGPVDEILGAGAGLIGWGVKQVVGKDNGGIVPGPIGAPRMILAHGGEEVIPRHKEMATGGNVVVNLYGTQIRSDQDVVALAREIEREKQRVMRARGQG